jgi:hypothetical protein
MLKVIFTGEIDVLKTINTNKFAIKINIQLREMICNENNLEMNNTSYYIF